jgi:anti-sigma-K factor RskA
MNLIPGELPDRLAAEYVLGTLTGGARRRFDALLPAHPALRHAVAAWESRLLPMALKAEAVQPDARVWRSIESQLGWTAPAAATPAPPWRLRFWQLFATVATVAAVVLGTVPRHAPTEAPMIVVLHATKGSDTLVAGLSPDRQQLTIQPLEKVSLTSDQSLELWALKKDGPPASLGVIAADKLTAINKRTLPKDTKGLAVTLEPLGGSPTGAPTGAIVFVGELTL